MNAHAAANALRRTKKCSTLGSAAGLAVLYSRRPDKTPDLEYFYPPMCGHRIRHNNLLGCEDDNVGYECMGEKPFEYVNIHGLVRDEQGRKMSKSLNNGYRPA